MDRLRDVVGKTRREIEAVRRGELGAVDGVAELERLGRGL